MRASFFQTFLYLGPSGDMERGKWILNKARIGQIRIAWIKYFLVRNFLGFAGKIPIKLLWEQISKTFFFAIFSSNYADMKQLKIVGRNIAKVKQLCSCSSWYNDAFLDRQLRNIQIRVERKMERRTEIQT